MTLSSNIIIDILISVFLPPVLVATNTKPNTLHHQFINRITHSFISSFDKGGKKVVSKPHCLNTYDTYMCSMFIHTHKNTIFIFLAETLTIMRKNVVKYINE